MNRPTFSPDFAARVEQALESLPSRRTEHTAVQARRSRRPVVVTIVVAALLLPLVLAALITAPRLAAPAGRIDSATAACDPAALRLFSCNVHSLSTNGDLSAPRYAGFRSWFDLKGGTPRYVVEEGDQTRVIPLRLEANRATVAPASNPLHWPQLSTCPATDTTSWICRIDGRLRDLATAGGHLHRSGKQVRLTSASGEVLVAVDTGNLHTYTPTTVQLERGRVLLTYRSSEQLDALTTGVLRVNAAGCLSIGDQVLVLPDDTVLQADGTITGHGRSLRLGQHIGLGGAGGSVPGDQRCGTGAYWYGWIP